MKPTHCIRTILTGAALSMATLAAAQASRSPEFDRPSGEERCDLSPSRAAERDTQVGKLTQRLQYAAAEAMDHPEFYEKVLAETKTALHRLGRVYGANCVISLR